MADLVGALRASGPGSEGVSGDGLIQLVRRLSPMPTSLASALRALGPVPMGPFDELVGHARRLGLDRETSFQAVVKGIFQEKPPSLFEAVRRLGVVRPRWISIDEEEA